ncbi:hypothetical protein [Streptomyces sp. WM6386]|uniref:hypothetical protein n=1 Tax=Streptomyces sp. WM6386 TaxID=1415558 RepID=UPI00061964B0|nr:hypothetical protein [Streptomyces sp. WM6386]KKD02843.1 hypothetical protein TN53_38370 [Streptomyces sp. WM6386]
MSFGPQPSMYTESTRTADKVRRRLRNRIAGATAAAVIAVLCLGGRLLWHQPDEAPANETTAAQQAPDEVRETTEQVPASPEGHLMALAVGGAGLKH